MGAIALIGIAGMNLPAIYGHFRHGRFPEIGSGSIREAAEKAAHAAGTIRA